MMKTIIEMFLFAFVYKKQIKRMLNVLIIKYLSLTKSNNMKKLFILFTAVTLFVGVQSCKQKPAEDETAAETTDSAAVETVDPTPAAAADSDTTRIPVPPSDPIKK